MHIPDGYLGPQTYGAMYVVMVPFWAAAGKKVRETLKARQTPLIALAAVFSFVVMMFNVPAPGGTTGHAVGAALAAIVLGPWAAMLAVSAALVVQALLFGDGGVTAIGANCFTMAVAMPFAAHFVYRMLWGGEGASARRRAIAAGIAGYVSLNAAAFLTALLFGIQPAIASRPDGTPLYAPYPLGVAIPAMMFEHLFLFGFIEAAVTGLVVAYLYKADPSLFAFAKAPAASAGARRPAYKYLWIALGVLVLLTPLGLIAPGTAWGEWSVEDIGKKLGFIPAGFSRLEGIWKAALPDYSLPGWDGTAGMVFAYILSAVIGITITALLIFVFIKIIAPRKSRDAAEEDAAWRA